MDDILVPSLTEVVVVGAGLAGCAVACLLAEAGAQVVVLDAHSAVGRGWSGACHGVAGIGYADHPVRLVHSLGDETARALVGATIENLADLDEWGLFSRKGALTAALGAVEEPEIEATIEILERWGSPVQALSASEVRDRLGGTSFGPGFLDPRSGAVDPPAAVLAVAARAKAAGVTFLMNAIVHGSRDAGLETEVFGEMNGHSFCIRTDVVVMCGGVDSGRIEPFLADKLYPVRFQMQHLAGADATGVPPLSAQLSYLQMAPRPSGELVLGGCRWATPTLEVGERDATQLSPAVDARLTQVRSGALGGILGDAVVVGRSAGIMAFSCDGLPIVGPVPGRVQHIVCTGWNGRPWSHALRAARAIRDGLVHGRSEGYPSILSPQRFV